MIWVKPNLNDVQKEFVLSFFKDTGIANWRGIGEKLITSGTCIIAGTDNIFRGGIGNFISCRNTNLAVDCLEYTFDVADFLTTNYCQERLGYHLTDAITELDAAKNLASSLTALTAFKGKS